MKWFHRCLFLTIFLGLLVILFSVRNIGYLTKPRDNWNGGEDLILNSTWLKMKEKCLRESRVTRIFLFSYMRGGSTLFSEIFNQDPLTDVMWYEPMDAFYQSYAGFQAHTIPLTILYYNSSMSRSLTERESLEITDYLESLLTCRIDKLPIETFAHNYFGHSTAFRKSAGCMARRHAKKIIGNCITPVGNICGNTDLIRRSMFIATANKCPEIIRALKATLPDEIELPTKESQNLYLAMRNKISKLVDGFSKEDEQRLNAFIDYHMCKAKAKFILKNCMDSIESTCKRARLVALKVIRSRMKDLEILIQRIPDIHVLYYTRDPRAIANSRLDISLPLVFSPTEKSVSAEAKILCHRMWEDLKAKKLLERKYPGSITMIRYEDFVQDFNGTIEYVFSQMKHKQSKRLRRWILRKQTAAEADDDKPFSTLRTNSFANVLNWKTKVNVSQQLEMNRHCRKVLLELGYDY